MRRNRIIQLWLCLLCLLPLQSMAQTLEYWFDDHYDQLGTTSIAATDAEQELSLDLRDNTKFPFGFHRLNMRVIIGGKPSSVYTSHVLKLSAGTASKIEYWVDDEKNAKNAKTVECETNNNGSTYQFIGNLDLSDVTPGHHRLYYRAVSNSGRTATAVSSTPILVKSKYYVENVEELKVTERMQWFDNEEPETITLSPSENIYRWEKDFDTRKLSEGQHTLHMQFGNSAGLWSSPLDVTFNKTKVKEPVITVNAGVFDGTLKMSFNTVPFGYRYTVGRKYPSGERRIVDQFKTNDYPATLTASDSPGLGTYTYYVIGEYYDTDGKRQEVRSQDIEATFDEVASNVGRGTIFVKEKIDGRSYHGGYVLYINGEKVTSQSSFKYKMDEYGVSTISDIPYGTEITIGIKRNKYKYNDQTLIVDENTKNRVLVFNGVESEEEEEEYLPSDSESDIALKENIHILPNAFEVKVKNLSTEPWSGNLKVVVISKEVKDYCDKVNSSEGLSIWETVFAPNAYYKDASYYTTAVDMPVNLGKSEEKILSLIISDMPKYGKNEYYYLYVFSKKDGATLTKTLAGYDNSNPQTLKFDPSDFGLAENFSHFMKKYAEVLKYVKKFAAWGDPFEKQITKIEEKAFDNFVDGFEKGEFDFVDLYADAEDAAFKSVGLLSSYIYDTNRWVTKMKKDIHYDALTNFEKLYNNVSGIYNATQADDNHKFFELAKCVLKVAKDQKLFNDPVVKCYTTYFEVGEAMLGAVERLHNEYKDWYVWERLISGEGIYKIKVRKYTGSNKRIEYFHGKDFYPHDNISHEGQIESISIKLKAPGLDPVECKDYKVELNNDGITITDVVFPLINNSRYATTEAWMTINWKNNRVTHVPLLDKHFVKLQNFSQASTEPLTMTVELQSETYMNHRRIANQLTFVEP